MSNKQLEPLEVNPQTEEPFLRLPHPHEDIIITPPRLDDVDRLVAIMNDPLVLPWMGRPGPVYRQNDAELWLKEVKAVTDAVARELANNAGESEKLQVVGGCPVRSIREVRADGTVYLGDINFKRCNWWEVQDEGERERLVNENTARRAGDPLIVWQVSDFLSPSHHRQGIMTMALATLLQRWAIPRMNVQHIRLAVFIGNHGSVRMFEKNGFSVVDTIENCLVVRGEARGLNVLEWYRS